MKPTLISIDWDFFIYNGEFDEDIILPDGERVPGALVYDFGHAESWSKFTHNVAWSNRVGLFDHIGLSLIEEHTIREDRGCIAPSSFFSEVTSRWDELRGAKTYFADSHKIAGEICRDLSTQYGPLRVINFDAHHDLGYGHESFKDRRRKISGWFPNWDCGDWLFTALATGWVDEAVIVYPDWRGFKEWNGYQGNPPEHLRKLAPNLNITTYSQYMQSPPADEQIVANFIARSSGWTPPYLDGWFLEFVHSFNVEECRDCARRGQKNSYKYDDACQPRSFDYDEILEEERDRQIIVAAIQRAHALHAEGRVEEAQAVIKLCREAGFDVLLDTFDKYQDSFPLSKAAQKQRRETPPPIPDEKYWDVEEGVWRSPWERPRGGRR